MRRHREIKTALLLLILQTSTAKPNKNTAPAVFEVVNEQARIDDKKIVPYANPLAGKSNAKLHAQHQQAMFNAERMRQHRAQLQRWNQKPTQIDSYMKAYQESQESHHLALELLQANMKDKKAKSRPERPLKDRPQLEPVKLTRADAADKSRSHRSYGSIHSNKNRFVHTYPGTTYDQGVTIKPNGNIGLHNYEKDKFELYTEAVPSKSQYGYPPLYDQTHGYQSANDVNALNKLLSKPPQEQLSQLKNLIHTVKETGQNNLEPPVDLFFYLKDPQLANAEPLQSSYAGPYAVDYINHKDHTPINEDVDDVENNEDYRFQAYAHSTEATKLSHVEDVTPKNNYYTIDIDENAHSHSPHVTGYASQTYKPTYQSYVKPLNFYSPSTEGVKYLKPQPTGVQHLSHDGTGVSAYGDDDVSIKRKRPKRQLETELFAFGNETIVTTAKSLGDNLVDPISNDTLIDLDTNCTISDTDDDEIIIGNSTIDFDIDRNETLPTPEEYKSSKFIRFDNAHQIGEAYDYDYSDYEDDPNYSNKYDYNMYDSDYDPDDLGDPDYDYEAPKYRPKPNNARKPNRQKKPYAHPVDNLDGSFSTRYSRFRHPNYYDYHPQPTDNDYRPPPQYLSDQYGPPLQYGPPQQFGVPTNSYGQPIQQYGPPYQPVQYGPPVNQNRPRPTLTPQYGPPRPMIDLTIPGSTAANVLDSLEPVYMLTQSQFKELVGQQKLNIEHLDVFQVGPGPKPKRQRNLKKQKKRYRRGPKRGRRNKAGKLRKLHKIVMF